jgi:hypothetical protein
MTEKQTADTKASRLEALKQRKAQIEERIKALEQSDTAKKRKESRHAIESTDRGGGVGGY